MFSGYSGKILFVDLTKGSTVDESLPENTYRDYIGGQGLGVKVLYERLIPKADPLGPDNIIGFVVGPLTGTGIHGARYQMVGKSPITGGWGEANSGGSLAVELKAAGYDGVFFSGISTNPVYLFLNDGQAELRDASHLWGKDTVETEAVIRDELGDKRVRIACVGPAGEAKSLLATVMHEGCAAARSGLAAVMGSKRLKALAVRGTKKVRIADAERFAALRRDYLKSVKENEHPFTNMLRKWGTCSFISPSIIGGDTPIKNWTMSGEEVFPNHRKLNGDEITKYQVKKHACLGCPIGCKGWLNVEKEPYRLTEVAKVEYETLALLGPNCLIDDLEAIIKANDLCNRYGIDTIGVGSCIAFAMECFERGIITKEDTDGIELTWGNAASMLAIVEKMVRREGFGALLADGSRLASERIGRGSSECTIHVGGQEVPAHDPRASIGLGWGYVCDPTPARHTSSHFKHSHDLGVPFATCNEVRFPKLDSLDMEDNAPVYATSSDLDRLFASAGLCIFAMWSALPIIEIISAVTGWDFTMAEGLSTGRRIQTLRQLFNIREGVNTSEWHLPRRLESPQSMGPIAGRKVNFKLMKERGYSALGWDSKTGKPLGSTMHELGLK